MGTTRKIRTRAFARWDFIHGSASWIWRRVGPEGAVLPSSTGATFGAAVGAAVTRGFQPDRDHWLVEDGDSVTYFPPDREPQTIPREPLQE